LFSVAIVVGKKLSVKLAQSNRAEGVRGLAKPRDRQSVCGTQRSSNHSRSMSDEVNRFVLLWFRSKATN